MEPVPTLVLPREHVIVTGTEPQQRQHDEYREKESVIRGKNSESASGVKRLEVAVASTGVDKDSRDQKSRQNEKEIHACPSSVGECDQRPRPAICGYTQVCHEVAGDHEQNGDAAQTIERKDVPALERSVNFAGGPIHRHRDRSSSHAETLSTERD
jgi:hypothetical protein